MNYKLFALTSLTLIFFAFNSILTRAALLDELIDAYSFTFIRLLSGSLMLLLIVFYKNKTIEFNIKSNWSSSFFLFLYAICFSYAYINLDAGIGALILFAFVQLFLIFIAVLKKEVLTSQKQFGIALAFIGLTYLLYPKEEFELSIFHLLLMIVSGIAWGVYTYLGKGSKNALIHTNDNFLKSILFITLFYFIFVENIDVTSQGILLATISGAITSAIGYSLWYYLLPKISIVNSGVIQLSVPVIAIFLGVLLLDETLTISLILSTFLILIGIFYATKNYNK